MQSDNIAKNAIRKTVECINLLTLFFLIETLINFISVKMTILGGEKIIFSFIPFFIIIPLKTLAYAGLYGSIFLKIKSQKVGVTEFVKSSKNNFIEFLRIGIFMGLVVVILNFLFSKYLLKYIPIFVSEKYHYTMVPYYFSRMVSFITEILFVFSFPLAIIGYFSNKKLKPIRTSFTIVFKHVKRIGFIIFILSIKLILTLLFKNLILSEYILYRTLLIAILTSPLTFLVLIYSYLKLTECFYKDLTFKFT